MFSIFKRFPVSWAIGVTHFFDLLSEEWASFILFNTETSAKETRPATQMIPPVPGPL